MDPAADLAAQLRNLGDRDAYVRAAEEMLRTVFPSEVIGWHHVDAAARTAKIVPCPDIPLEGMAERLIETADENPFFQSYVGLKPLGIDRQIVLLSDRIGPVAVRAWAISRSGRDFTDSEGRSGAPPAAHAPPPRTRVWHKCGAVGCPAG